jgi:hypothetical protein
MAYQLHAFSDVGLNEALLELAIAEHAARTLPRLERWWNYYRNPMKPSGAGGVEGGRYRLAQEAGLPRRLTGRGPDPQADDRSSLRREVVIENDIGWRVQAMVDFLFAKPVRIVSTARDAETRAAVERVLDAVWEGSGGIALLQDMALLGHVFGHVDLMVRRSAVGAESRDPAESARELVRIEVIEPRRAIAILDPGDYRKITAYIVRFERRLNRPGATDSWLARLGSGLGAGLNGGLGQALRLGAADRAAEAYTEIVSAARRQVYHGPRLVEDRALTAFGGEIPVVHIQNIAQPFAHEGLGEVEPLVPLQDELNIRLSDRASRVTMQSFKMYLAKGIENFDARPVGPGQVWVTSDMDAQISEFGGDAASPSEESHIREVREAMDKVSGVPPLASGVVRAKIGNLTSANALRITLMGLLSKTARKRVTYGRGMIAASRLVLAALDQAGVLRTEPADRGVRLEWPDPLPTDERESVQAAEAKVRLGVDPARVIDELGYGAADAGVQ